MKDEQIVTLEKLAEELKDSPFIKHELYAEFLSILEEIKIKKAKQKQNYEKNSEYHREKTRKWRVDNKEKHLKYQKEWRKKKRTKTTKK